MKRFPLLILLLALSGSLFAAERPNIVFILSDDQGWNDYGFMGHPHIETPRLDQLASESLVYERGYVAAPLCRASLASLATGLHPHQTGIRGNDPEMPDGMSKQKDLVVHRELRGHMTAPVHSLPTFIRELTKSGYATLQTGKWWEGNPIEHGFTHAMSHGDTSRGGRHGDVGLQIGRKTYQPYYDFVDEAVAKDQPFFVWYGVFLPHTPHNAPDRLYQKYKDVAPNESTARYWANVEWFDETCGEILGYLEKKGIADNTIIVYICDNGWVPDPEQVARFVRSKREPVEAGIRSPIMIRHTGKVKARRDKETLASAIDIGPTLLKASGIKVPKTMPGLDLRDTAALAKRNYIVSEAYEHDSDLDHLDDVNHQLTGRVIIEGWDKLIQRQDRYELFDLKKDPDDRNDIAAKNPKRVKELKAKLDAWLEATQ